MCTECIRSCPHDNLNINFREPGRDLFKKDRYRTDEAILSLILISLTTFHGITMTPVWDELLNTLRIFSGMSHTSAFSILMSLIMTIPFVLYLFTSKVSMMLSRGRQDFTTLFQAFAYPLIPVAFFYHIAHNTMHFTLEASLLIPALSDPFGFGWDLFSTAAMQPGDLISQKIVWWFQLLFIIIGHIYGVITAASISKKLFGDSGKTSPALIPQIVLLILLSEFSILLIAQTMDMRTGL